MSEMSGKPMRVDKTGYGCRITDPDFLDIVAVELEQIPQLVGDLARVMGQELEEVIMVVDPTADPPRVEMVALPEEEAFPELTDSYPQCIYFFATVVII